MTLHTKLSNAFTDLPLDSTQRHESFVTVFGESILGIRRTGLQLIQELLESEERRQRLGNIWRRPYERCAGMNESDRAAALELARVAVDSFIQRLLYLLGNTGTDFDWGSQHAIRFLLTLEVLDSESGDVVEEHVINREGKKFFGDYWGRWLNQFGTLNSQGKVS